MSFSNPTQTVWYTLLNSAGQPTGPATKLSGAIPGSANYGGGSTKFPTPSKNYVPPQTYGTPHPNTGNQPWFADPTNGSTYWVNQPNPNLPGAPRYGTPSAGAQVQIKPPSQTIKPGQSFPTVTYPGGKTPTPPSWAYGGGSNLIPTIPSGGGSGNNPPPPSSPPPSGGGGGSQNPPPGGGGGGGGPFQPGGGSGGGAVTNPGDAFGGSGDLFEPGDTNTYWNNPPAALHQAIANAGMPTNTQNTWYQFLQNNLPQGLSVLYDLFGGQAGEGFSGFMQDYLGNPASRSDLGSLLSGVLNGGQGVDPLAMAAINQTTDPEEVLRYLNPLIQTMGTTGLNRMALGGIGNRLEQSVVDYDNQFNYGGLDTPFLNYLKNTGVFNDFGFA